MPEDDAPKDDLNKPVSPWPSRAPNRATRKPNRQPVPTSPAPQKPTENSNGALEQSSTQPNNPLHGVKLAEILEYLVDEYGWAELSARIDIRCFYNEPSIKSSLKFLRRTQWARDKVERLYLQSTRRRSRG